MTFQPMISNAARKNYDILRDFLKRISYKPGWTISISEEPTVYGFVVTVNYEGYESENSGFSPLAKEDRQVTAVRARLMGKTIRHPEMRCYSRNFDMLSLDTIPPEHIIRYVIADTIKQAEIFEFERWFKVEGYRVFGE